MKRIFCNEGGVCADAVGDRACRCSICLLQWLAIGFIKNMDKVRS